jgi:hypothetical protein
VPDLAHAVARAHRLYVSTKAAFNKLMANTRAFLSQPREGVVREAVDGVYRLRADTRS